ncbi:hypothetical protein D3C75_884580 [compost metagenome]
MLITEKIAPFSQCHGRFLPCAKRGQAAIRRYHLPNLNGCGECHRVDGDLGYLRPINHDIDMIQLLVSHDVGEVDAVLLTLRHRENMMLLAL